MRAGSWIYTTKSSGDPAVCKGSSAGRLATGSILWIPISMQENPMCGKFHFSLRICSSPFLSGIDVKMLPMPPKRSSMASRRMNLNLRAWIRSLSSDRIYLWVKPNKFEDHIEAREAASLATLTLEYPEKTQVVQPESPSNMAQDVIILPYIVPSCKNFEE